MTLQEAPTATDGAWYGDPLTHARAMDRGAAMEGVPYAYGTTPVPAASIRARGVDL